MSGVRKKRWKGPVPVSAVQGVLLKDNRFADMELVDRLKQLRVDRGRAKNLLDWQQQSFVLNQAIKETELREMHVHHTSFLPEVTMKVTEPNVRARRPFGKVRRSASQMIDDLVLFEEKFVALPLLATQSSISMSGISNPGSAHRPGSNYYPGRRYSLPLHSTSRAGSLQRQHSTLSLDESKLSENRRAMLTQIHGEGGAESSRQHKSALSLSQRESNDPRGDISAHIPCEGVMVMRDPGSERTANPKSDSMLTTGTGGETFTHLHGIDLRMPTIRKSKTEMNLKSTNMTKSDIGRAASLSRSNRHMLGVERIKQKPHVNSMAKQPERRANGKPRLSGRNLPLYGPEAEAEREERGKRRVRHLQRKMREMHAHDDDRFVRLAKSLVREDDNSQTTEADWRKKTAGLSELLNKTLDNGGMAHVDDTVKSDVLGANAIIIDDDDDGHDYSSDDDSDIDDEDERDDNNKAVYSIGLF